MRPKVVPGQKKKSHSQQLSAMLSSAGYWEDEPELLASILAPAQWLGTDCVQ